MKSTLLKTVFALIAFALPLIAQARVVTLVVSPTNTTASVTIGTNEVATIVTFHTASAANQGPSLSITAAGVTTQVLGELRLNSANSYVVAGPATITLTSSGGNTAFCTVQIDSASSPPDRTLIISADSRGVNIIMESSSDLINWTTALPGVRTNTTGNLFFRIRAERNP